MVRSNMSVQPEESREDEVLTEAKKRFQIAKEGWDTYRGEANDTMKFFYGDQWDSQLKMNREDAGLPALSVNLLGSFMRQITNEVRQNTPTIQIDPKDNIGSEDTSEVLSDLIRTIQNESDATTAYDIAASAAASVGLGYFRVVSEYESNDSFEQKLVIKQIDDAATVYLDPTHRDAAGSDANYVFILSTVSKEDYQRLYGDSKLAQKVAEVGWTVVDNQWISEHEVTIAEYYYKDWELRTLYEVLDMATLQKFSTFELDKDAIKAGLIKPIRDRKVQVPVIRWCKINDVEILEETVWPGQWIPVVCVKGEEVWVDGKRKLKGALQDAIDSQKALNYFFSLQAELVQLAPKTPFIGEIRQFANFEHLWRDANVAPNAYLPYNAVSLEGTALPPPQRQSVEVPIQSATSLCQQAHDNLKSIFGIFNDQLGDSSNAESGKAVLARTALSHTTNYHWYDNLVRSITHLGRIIVEAIPVFYDTERLVQVTNAAGDKRPVVINGFDPRKNKFIDLTKGKFDVVVQTGASYSTRRQEAVQSMMALGQAYPNALPAIADIIVRNMDWPGAKEIAARLHAAVPPEILQATEEDVGEDPKQLVGTLKVQVKQQGQQLQALNAHAANVEQELKATKQELDLTKMDKSIQMRKAELDFHTDNRKLDIDEMTVEIQARLDARKLDLQEKQLQLEGAELATDVASDMMDHAHKKAKHDHEVKNVFSETSIENPSMDADLGGKLN